VIIPHRPRRLGRVGQSAAATVAVVLLIATVTQAADGNLYAALYGSAGFIMAVMLSRMFRLLMVSGWHNTELTEENARLEVENLELAIQVTAQSGDSPPDPHGH
jgi:hypothetical protein